MCFSKIGLLVVLTATLLSRQVTSTAPVKPVRRVLIFYELGFSSPAITFLDREILSALENSPFQIELYREYLETTLFSSPAEQQELREGFLRKYRGRRPDLIIALGPSPLRFITDVHERAFKDIPVVFGGTSVELADYPNLDSHFAGVWEKPGPEKTLAVALRLQPATRRVVVVGGTSSYDRHVEALFRDRLRDYQRSLDIEYLTDLDMPTLLDRLAHLPQNTIVLYANFEQDAAGTPFIAASQADPMMAGAANAPIFTPSDVDWGHGEVGGYVQSFSEEGKIVGKVTQAILAGKSPSDVPIEQGANVYMFDWRALRRWGFRESDLPPGSIVLNRQPTLWEAYKWYIVGGLFLLLAQALLIVGLLWQRARRRKAEFELGKSERKFSKAFHQSPLAITILNASNGRYVEANESFEIQTGWRRAEVIGRTPFEIGVWVDPEQRTAFMKQLLTKGHVKDLEVQLRRKDGQVRTSLGSAELIEVSGEPCILSVFADITERKQAEEAISGFSRRLIEAQEAERTRIARELHDDINQRLAMLAISLETAKQAPSKATADSLLDEAGARVSDLENDIQALSHRLHSSKLEYLGLEAAASSFCRELSEHQNVKIDFNCENIPEDLSSEVSLCLFRVLQEALHNAAKHSGVDEFEVSLTGIPNAIELRVHDSGAGFDAKRTSNGHGLGLTSMRERLKLVSGELCIDSEPGHGTNVLARVPLVEERSTAGAAA